MFRKTKCYQEDFGRIRRTETGALQSDTEARKESEWVFKSALRPDPKLIVVDQHYFRKVWRLEEASQRMQDEEEAESERF